MESCAELVALLGSGDEAAWRRFMSTHGRLALLAGRKIGLTPTEQDEVFQETCVSVYRSIRSLRDPESLPVWVFSIARHHAIRLIRRRTASRGDGDGELENVLDDSLTPLEIAEKIDRAARVRRAVEEMDPRCRRLLTAIYLDPGSPSYAEIAEREGLPIGSIGPTRARCLGKLRKLLTSVSEGAARGSILWEDPVR